MKEKNNGQGCVFSHNDMSNTYLFQYTQKSLWLLLSWNLQILMRQSLIYNCLNRSLRSRFWILPELSYWIKENKMLPSIDICCAFGISLSRQGSWRRVWFSQKEVPLSPTSVSPFTFHCSSLSKTFSSDLLLGIGFEILMPPMKKKKSTHDFTDETIGGKFLSHPRRCQWKITCLSKNDIQISSDLILVILGRCVCVIAS